MKYNFKAKISLTDEENAILSNKEIGFFPVATIDCLISVDAKTEIQGELLDRLDSNVQKLLSDKFGIPVEAELFSTEY